MSSTFASLAWDAKGNLIAGSDGSGLVYRISPEGKGYVLFEAPRREITSVAVAADGTIYAASVGEKGHNPLPPLPVQGVGTITFTIVQPASLQAANTSTSVPEGSEIYALQEGQAPRKVWSGKDEIVYALAARPDGVLALSGNRGHIFRIQPDGDYADVAHLDAQQGLSLARCAAGGRTFLIGTGQYRQADSRWARRRSMNTQATCWMQARWHVLAAWRLSRDRRTTSCGRDQAMWSSRCADGASGSR